MSTRRILWIVLGTIVVIGLLSAGGYALYRAGYVRGVRVSAAQMMPGDFRQGFMDHFMDRFEDRFPGEFGDRFGDRFGGKLQLDRARGRFTQHDPYPYYLPFPTFWVIPGFLLLVGVVALVVIAVNSFARSKPENDSRESPSKVKKS